MDDIFDFDDECLSADVIGHIGLFSGQTGLMDGVCDESSIGGSSDDASDGEDSRSVGNRLVRGSRKRLRAFSFETGSTRSEPSGNIGSPMGVVGGTPVEVVGPGAFAPGFQLDVGAGGGLPANPVGDGHGGGNNGVLGTRFLFSSKKGHLTYAGHIERDVLLALVGGAAELVWWSVVWEQGHDGDDDGGGITPYDHTHFAFERKRKFCTRDVRRFDVGGVHPHIRSSIDAEHASRLYWEYHRKSPVQLWQSESGPKRPGNASDIGRIKAAPSLFEACQIAGIVPRSVGDIQLLRNDRERRRPAEHDFPGHVWALQLPADFRVLFLWGRTNTGKTQRAIHAFERPLLVSQIDDLRDFDPAVFDGIVFDDMDFKKMEGGSVIHLLDWDCDRPIRCRYSNAVIPKHTRKIFTSNTSLEGTFFGVGVAEEQMAAIRRRVSHVIHVTAPTF